MVNNRTSSQIEAKKNTTFSGSVFSDIISSAAIPPGGLTIPDALITVALYVCLNAEGYNGYHHFIDKTMDLAEISFCFTEYPEDVLRRIYRCINLFRVSEPDMLFQEALRLLPAELKQTAFE